MYGKKVRKLESAEYLAVNKPALELNVGAANRFISHAIPDLSREQKVALKEVRCIPSFHLATQPFRHSISQNLEDIVRVLSKRAYFYIRSMADEFTYLWVKIWLLGPADIHFSAGRCKAETG